MSSFSDRTRRLLVTVLARVGRWISAMLWGRAVRAPNVAEKGIPIRPWLVEREKRAEAIKTVRDALRLIEKFDPARYSRIQRDLDGIVVSPIIPPGTAGVYHTKHRVCGINPNGYPSNPGLVATVIVHEATHARLRRFSQTGNCAARIEGICRAQELAFLARVPLSEEIREIFRKHNEQRAREFEDPYPAKSARAMAALRREVPQKYADATERVAGWILNLLPKDR